MNPIAIISSRVRIKRNNNRVEHAAWTIVPKVQEAFDEKLEPSRQGCNRNEINTLYLFPCQLNNLFRIVTCIAIKIKQVSSFG